MSWKDHIFEHEPEKPATKVPVPVMKDGPMPPTTVVPAFVPDATSTSIADGKFYQKLLAKTDFDATDNGKTFNKYLAPLASVPGLADGLKVKAALAQAAQEGLTPDKFLATFDAMQATLSAESQKFDGTISAMTNLEITDRQGKIADINKKIEDLKQQEVELAAAMGTAQAKIDSAKAEFAGAFKRRESEINSQKENYRRQIA